MPKNSEKIKTHIFSLMLMSWNFDANDVILLLITICDRAHVCDDRIEHAGGVFTITFLKTKVGLEGAGHFVSLLEMH